MTGGSSKQKPASIWCLGQRLPACLKKEGLGRIKEVPKLPLRVDKRETFRASREALGWEELPTMSRVPRTLEVLGLGVPPLLVTLSYSVSGQESVINS